MRSRVRLGVYVSSRVGEKVIGNEVIGNGRRGGVWRQEGDLELSVSREVNWIVG